MRTKSQEKLLKIYLVQITRTYYSYCLLLQNFNYLQHSAADIAFLFLKIGANYSFQLDDSRAMEFNKQTNKRQGNF